MCHKDTASPLLISKLGVNFAAWGKTIFSRRECIWCHPDSKGVMMRKVLAPKFKIYGLLFLITSLFRYDTSEDTNISCTAKYNNRIQISTGAQNVLLFRNYAFYKHKTGLFSTQEMYLSVFCGHSNAKELRWIMSLVVINH